MTTKPESGNFPWQHLPRPAKIYGAATVGERGQIALPADARRELGIDPGDKLMVFANKINGSIVLVKADIFESFADFFMTKLNKLENATQNFFDAFTTVTAEAAPEDDEAAPAEAAAPEAAEAAAQEAAEAAGDNAATTDEATAVDSQA